MGKLFTQLFKEDIKKVLAWMLSPLLVTVAGSFLYKTTSFQPLGLIIFISMSIMTFAPLISLASLAGNDDSRFYGKKASFYTALPFTPSQVTGARLINYIVMGLVIGIFSFFNILLFSLTGGTDLAPLEIIKFIFRTIDLKLVIIMLKAALILDLFYAIFAQTIMAASTLGSARPFNKIGKAAKPAIFVLLFLIQSFAYSKTIAGIGNSGIIEFEEYRKTIGTGYINILDLNWPSLGLVVLILGAFVLIYFALISYFHKGKISVE